MMGRFRHVFDTLRARRGEWVLFAVLYRGRHEPGPWDLFVAAPWITDAEQMKNLGEILGVLREVTTPLQMADVGVIVCLTEPHDIADAARSLLRGRPIEHPVGLVRRKNFDFRGQHLRRAFVWAANLPESMAMPAPAA